MKENADYLSRQLITYIGTKRRLLRYIADALEHVKRRLNKSRLCLFDAFAGSGVVSRLFKSHAAWLVSNDIEDYAAVLGRCYLRNRSTVDLARLAEIVEEFNARVDTEDLEPGFIEQLYAPRDDAHIRPGERVFYTRENARRLDNYRRMIAALPPDLHDLLLGPLLSEASIHANTAGVFKGFYKDRKTGLGQFGGAGRDALKRILGPIRLQVPILSASECDYEVFQEDANTLAPKLKGIDLACLDPPYNQHPYGSNYFMLNLLVRYERPTDISRVSGIPGGWKRSAYNVRARAYPTMRELVSAIDAPFVLVSCNSEGFIGPGEMSAMLAEFGTVTATAVPYTAFRGSRNLRNRSTQVVEHFFLVERR